MRVRFWEGQKQAERAREVQEQVAYGQHRVEKKLHEGQGNLQEGR